VTAPEIEAVFPAFPRQEALLAGASSAGGCGHRRWEIAGPLDADLLERAWQTVVAAYAAPRAALAWRRVERPLQVVRRSVPAPIERHDWSGVAAVEAADRLRELLAEAAMALEPSRPPLMRLFLCRRSPERHLVVAVHHLCLFDDESSAFLVERLMETYAGLRCGDPPALPVCRYPDYVAWLKAQDHGAEEELWRRRACTPAAGSFFDGSWPADAETSWRRDRRLSAAVAERLATGEAGGEARLVAAWALAVARYTGGREVVVGTSTPGRPEAVAGPLVGPFSSALPIAVRLPREARVDEWLAEVTALHAETFRFPFSAARRIQAWWGVEGGGPWPETVVRREAPRPASFRADGLEVRGAIAGGLPAPLVLELSHHGDRLGAYVIYTSGSTGRPKGVMNRTGAW
jgi:hypothetical protein